MYFQFKLKWAQCMRGRWGNIIGGMITYEVFTLYGRLHFGDTGKTRTRNQRARNNENRVSHWTMHSLIILKRIFCLRNSHK